MSARVSYTFFGYTLRPATAEDIELARAWTAADPDHRGVIAPEFWVEQAPGIDSYVLVDAAGPVFFFRMQRAVRLFVQFAPIRNKEDEKRAREGIFHGVNFLAAALSKVHIAEMLFDSASKLLRLYVVGRLRFIPREGTLSRAISILRPDVLSKPPEPLSMDSMENLAPVNEHGTLQRER